MNSNIELQQIWEKYTNIPLYRVTPICDYEKIKVEGLDPQQDPYDEVKPHIDVLEEVVARFEGQGDKFFLHWRTKDVLGSYALDRMQDDMGKKHVDFAPDKAALDYYMPMRGGANTHGFKQILDNIKKYSEKLTSKEKETLQQLEIWVHNRICDNVSIYIQGGSKYVETALFQLRSLDKDKRVLTKKAPRKYLDNPFGTFEHFSAVVNEENIDDYLPYLESKRFYIRITDSIPPSEISLVK
jgi:hypothetical protein